MQLSNDIVKYNDGLEAGLQKLANQFCVQIAEVIPQAEGKVWHGHPVWFIDGNPVAGYSLKKTGLEVLFWSGQSFKNPGLRAIGKFQAAAFLFATEEDLPKMATWLQEAIKIQWDYANLPKKRALEKLTSF